MAAAAALVFLLAAGAAAYEPCGARLHGLSRESGAPGDEFAMFGVWGRTQGPKLPVINRGGQNKLEVVEWRHHELRVRVPQGLRPGKYRVGLYCNPLSQGGTYGSGFLDFEVLPAGSAAPPERGLERPLIDPADRRMLAAKTSEPAPRPRPRPQEAPVAQPFLDARAALLIVVVLGLPLLWFLRPRRPEDPGRGLPKGPGKLP